MCDVRISVLHPNLKLLGFIALWLNDSLALSFSSFHACLLVYFSMHKRLSHVRKLGLLKTQIANTVRNCNLHCSLHGHWRSGICFYPLSIFFFHRMWLFLIGYDTVKYTSRSIGRLRNFVEDLDLKKIEYRTRKLNLSIIGDYLTDTKRRWAISMSWSFFDFTFVKDLQVGFILLKFVWFLASCKRIGSVSYAHVTCCSIHKCCLFFLAGLSQVKCIWTFIVNTCQRFWAFGARKPPIPQCLVLTISPLVSLYIN